MDHHTSVWCRFGVSVWRVGLAFRLEVSIWWHGVSFRFAFRFGCSVLPSGSAVRFSGSFFYVSLWRSVWVALSLAFDYNRHFCLVLRFSRSRAVFRGGLLLRHSGFTVHFRGLFISQISISNVKPGVLEGKKEVVVECTGRFLLFAFQLPLVVFFFTSVLFGEYLRVINQC